MLSRCVDLQKKNSFLLTSCFTWVWCTHLGSFVCFQLICSGYSHVHDWILSIVLHMQGLSHSRCRQLMGICQGNKKNTSESAVRTCGGGCMHPVCLVGLAVCTPCVLWRWLYAPRVPSCGGLAVCTPCVWGWLYGSRVWIANELTVQLMLSYGAPSNCPITNLPHPTCYEAQGWGPTPSLASSHLSPS